MSQAAMSARVPPAEVWRKLEATLVALWDPGEAEGSQEDEKKLGADSPAVSHYMLKYFCKRC
jgi:hypothetical protein